MPKKEYVNGLEGLIEARGDVFGGHCDFLLESIDPLAAEIWGECPFKEGWGLAEF